AAHQLFDDEPKLLEDPLAVTLLGDELAQQLRSARERHSSWYMKKARTLAILRSRFTEERLRDALARGVTQYVILGAGLDTSPYRPGHPGESLTTFEIDHPDTQRWKLDRLREAGVDVRDNLHHMTIDFERQSLLDGLVANGFDAAQPTFFSWLGVIYYLRPDVVADTFRQIASCAPGSGLVIDFVVSDDDLSPDEQATVAKVEAFAASQGEPWLTRVSPAALQALLSEAGFGNVEYVSRDAATAMYLTGRTDDLSLDASIQLMSAIV
ncbi:MAG: class I SAM-dependent methyltransferase, partial [Gammaproteobacteria bacterium]